MDSFASCRRETRSASNVGSNVTVATFPSLAPSVTSARSTLKGGEQRAASVSGSGDTFVRRTVCVSGPRGASSSYTKANASSDWEGSTSGCRKVPRTTVSRKGLPGLPPAGTSEQCRVSSASPRAAVNPRTTKVHSESGSIRTFSGTIVKVDGTAIPAFAGGADAFDHAIVCDRRPRFSRVNSMEHMRDAKRSPKSRVSSARSLQMVEPVPVAASERTCSGASLICRIRSSATFVVSSRCTERESSRVSPGSSVPSGVERAKGEAALRIWPLNSAGMSE
mmetsp:Transcript_39788/g.118076  ORF Transcript_39788/g.118076 Transcript_39788/m.118076 type:complete len:279 (-) Transcript_39788:1616-2452(-)